MLLLALSALTSADNASSAVMKVYSDACVRGQVRLDSRSGHIIKEKELPSRLQWMDRSRVVTSKTYIKMIEPPSTYIAIREFKETGPKAVSLACAVISRSIKFEDAFKSLMEGVGDGKVTVPCDNLAVCSPVWAIDSPQQGFRKTLKTSLDGWITVQTEIYAPSLSSNH